MKIRYNIAKNKRIDYFKFALTISIAVLISILFTAVGVYNLSATAKQFRDKKAVLESKENKLEEIRKDIEEVKAKKQKKEKKWGKVVKFCNDLIKGKGFPYREKLDKLEGLLPVGVFIRDLSLSAKSGSRVHLDIASFSSEKLLEAYRIFQKYELNIKSESSKEVPLKASLQIELK